MPGIEGILRSVITQRPIPLYNLSNIKRITGDVLYQKKGVNQKKMTRDLGNRKSNPGGKKGKGKFHGDSCVIGLGC